MAIPIPIPEESCTADKDGKTLSCDAKPPEQQPPEQQPPEQQSPEQQPQEPQEPEAGKTEGIRTTPIPIPGGSQGKPQQHQQQQQPQQQQQAQSSGGGGPGMRNLVRFLNNPEGAMTSNDSAYLRTMYSTDSADLVYKSAMSSGSYY